MDLVHVVLTRDALDALDGHEVEREPSRIVLSCVDATTVVALGAVADRLTGPIGVWLEVDGDYSAPLCARDVATLSWLINLDTVVISASSHAPEHAAVVEALLSDDEVTIVNEVATVVAAYNRPAPPRPVDVWSFNGSELRRGERTLRATHTEPRFAGLATTYA